jgi:hypothetical protein
VTAPEHYTTVDEFVTKRNEGITHGKLPPKQQDLIYEMLNYPNPFNAGTTISFSLPQANRVSLVVYNTHGQRIKVLISDQAFPAGKHQVLWNGKSDQDEDIASGVYLCRLTSGTYGKLIRLVMLK